MAKIDSNTMTQLTRSVNQKNLIKWATQATKENARFVCSLVVVPDGCRLYLALETDNEIMIKMLRSAADALEQGQSNILLPGDKKIILPE